MKQKRVKSSVLLAGLLLAASLFITSSRVSADTFTGQNGQIAIGLSGSLGVVDSNIYTVNPDGSNVQPFGTPPVVSGYIIPSWSPDGTRLVYSTGNPNSPTGTGTIHLINADGTGGTEIFNDPDLYAAGVDFTADGTKIIFSAYDPGVGLPSAEIYTINLDGSGLINLTNTPALAEFAPSSSPNGTTVAYHASADGLTGLEIYTMSSGGGAGTQVSAAEGQYPHWAPDSSRIIYTNVNSIITMDPDGGNAATHPGPQTVVFPGAVEAIFSPDGTRILTWGNSGFSVFVIMDASDGGNDIEITDASSFIAGGLAWQPLVTPVTPPVTPPTTPPSLPATGSPHGKAVFLSGLLIAISGTSLLLFRKKKVYRLKSR